jgi:hypothetical protein
MKKLHGKKNHSRDDIRSFNLQQDGRQKLFQHLQFSLDQLLERLDNLQNLEKHF